MPSQMEFVAEHILQNSNERIANSKPKFLKHPTISSSVHETPYISTTNSIINNEWSSWFWRPPAYMNDYTLAITTSTIEPKTLKIVLKNSQWMIAMGDKLQALHDNETWTLVPHPPDATVIGSIWVYHIKYKEDGFRIALSLSWLCEISLKFLTSTMMKPLVL